MFLGGVPSVHNDNLLRNILVVRHIQGIQPLLLNIWLVNILLECSLSPLVRVIYTPVAGTSLCFLHEAVNSRL